ALLLVAHLYAGVTVASFGAAMIAALVLGLLNAVLRPLLVLLTLPVTLVTLGLFLFVINALMFYAAASVLDGFGVVGFGAALIGSLIYSVCGLVI
ncbi:phage holin family protein, partial [Salmonella enterica]|uniref:phage holin family protein n=1 Tax=Salmonella enterica TaxID=28901 RepID=UPI003FA69F06